MLQSFGPGEYAGHGVGAGRFALDAEDRNVVRYLKYITVATSLYAGDSYSSDRCVDHALILTILSTNKYCTHDSTG